MELPQPLIDAFWATVQSLLVTVTPVVVLYVGGKVIKVAQDIWGEFKSQNANAAYEIENAIKIGMKAAEQTALIGEIAQLGSEKKEYAVKFAQDWLAKQGIKIDVTMLEALVESNIQDLFPQDEDEDEEPSALAA